VPGPALIAAAGRARRGGWRRLAAPVLGGALGAFAAVIGTMIAITGTDLSCLAGASASAATGPAPSRSARADIPRARLAIYRAAGARFHLDWTFLASIGAQECSHGSCAGDNGSGCAGPMQISFRRGSPCSPGSGPTEWDLNRTDGDGDGHADINNPADAIFTAARVLRLSKGAPRTGGSYASYRQAACRYYGACADSSANYADQVMARAVQYGFRGVGASAPTDPARALAAPVASGDAGGCGQAAGAMMGAGPLGPVRRLYAPARLATLSTFAVAPGGGLVSCDARIVADVNYLTRRYGVWVTACYAIHSLTGDHPLGAAIDVVPRDGDWSRTMRLARAIGWQPVCAGSGTAPSCARLPFRFVAYNGFPNHGDPAHCVPCAGGAHLHISWQTSSSLGQPDNRPRTTYSPARWIDAFTVPGQAPSA
jgi:hypothetical protein